MDNMIEFIDFKTGQKGRRMDAKSLSVWYNINGKQKTYGMTFSSDIKTNASHVRVGKLGNETVIVFNNEAGIKILANSNPKKNVMFHSKGFAEMIFPKLPFLKDGKDRKVFSLNPIGTNIYVIQEK